MVSLNESALFDGLDERTLNKIQDLGETLTLEKDEILFNEEETGDDLFLVTEGLLKITLLDRLGDRKKTLALLGPGEFVGEMAILTDHERSGRARAVYETELFRLDGEDFTNLLLEVPRLGINLSSILCDRLAKTDEDVESMAFKTVQEQLADQLLKLAHQHGRKTNDHLELRLNLTHAMLADLIGSHRETVSRHMTELMDKGIIEKTDDSFLIKKPDRLQSIASQTFS